MLKRLRRLDEAESQLLFAYPHAIDEYEKADIQYNLACVYAMQKRRQDMLDACAIVRNPKCDEYRKALKGTGERLTIAKQILAHQEARGSHLPLLRAN